MDFSRRSILRCWLATAVVLAPLPVVAQQSDTDPVFVFNRICYSQVPNVRAIEDMAARFAWERIGGEDLRQFSPVDEPGLLAGWDARIEDRIYRVGIVQSGLTSSFREAFPDFANGTATGCTIVLDGSDETDGIRERMTTLAGKEPGSTAVPDEDLLTTTWAGGNADFKVFLIMKSGTSGKANVLNVTILSREAP